MLRQSNNIELYRKHSYILYGNSNAVKFEKSQLNIFENFHNLCQNLDYGYTLEPPHRVPTIYGLDQDKKIRFTPTDLSFMK